MCTLFISAWWVYCICVTYSHISQHFPIRLCKMSIQTIQIISTNQKAALHHFMDTSPQCDLTSDYSYSNTIWMNNHKTQTGIIYCMNNGISFVLQCPSTVHNMSQIWLTATTLQLGSCSWESNLSDRSCFLDPCPEPSDCMMKRQKEDINCNKLKLSWNGTEP